MPPVSHLAWALEYPIRPVRLICGYPAGGIVDVFARLIGGWLSERLGKPFIVEDRIGAASNLATEAVVRAPPDGYMLLTVSTTSAINATLYDNLGFRLTTDIAPIASLYRNGPTVVVVNPLFPAKTLPEFIAYAKDHPGAVNMGSSGIGSPPHVFAELFKSMAGIELLHVPYRGQPQVLADLLSGQLQVTFDPLANSIGHIRAGRLRALAVTTSVRVAALPEVPTVAEFVAGYEASSWQGIGAPKNTPPEIIERLNHEINAGLAAVNMKMRFAELGGYAPYASSPGEFGKFIADEIEKWSMVIRGANIKPE